MNLQVEVCAVAGRGRPSRATLYTRLSRALTELNERYGGLPSPTEAQEIWSDIWHQEAHHSTALEGNTLVLREVRTLLEQGRAVGAKSLREYNEVQGYADAAKWVYGQALEPDSWHDGNLLTINELRRVHHMAMTPVWDVAPHPDATQDEGPGSFRRHDIEPFAEGMKPPTWPLVPAQIQEWVDAVCVMGERVEHGENLGVPIAEELAKIHNAFERVHPFIDGNGRAGRLVLNLVLVRLGYPPIIIFKRQRSAYLKAMRRADAGDYGALGELIARAMEDNLNRFIVPNLAGPARLVPLQALANGDLSMAALRQAAQRGRLKAVQGPDGIWRSSQRFVEAYRKSRYRTARRR
ncbi:Fic family protein [Phytoactinopolyspora alkaliphila]|uniref:Fic family protein n=1 Tax=Phytoactinopolyspora alkaliphila TaxID=1783498 RepID=A0A6N9YIK5_9ACTN|nr:Fic family protein [Phytoactinopolyspora alkaliphila]NED94787.1 Fic family protein [Phytoactinopolyspora alkaliphila]